MKEDVLEQIVDDYLQHKGYFTRHNIKFRPNDRRRDFDVQKDSVYSDIDVIGVNPLKRGYERVYVVSCKSWQVGFNTRTRLEEVTNNKFRSGRESWKYFRELARKKWGDAFVDAVRVATGYEKFTYITAVTRIIGDPAIWEQYKPFRKSVGGNPIRLIGLPEMLDSILNETGTTVASSEIGRMLQVIKASRWLDSKSSERRTG